MSEPIHRRSTEGVSIFINGEETQAATGIAMGIRNQRATVLTFPITGGFAIEHNSLDARTFRYLFGTPMPGSVQATFRYRGARERRNERLNTFGWWMKRWSQVASLTNPERRRK